MAQPEREAESRGKRIDTGKSFPRQPNCWKAQRRSVSAVIAWKLLVAGRLCGPGVLVGGPHTTGSPFPTWTFKGSTSLWKQFTTTPHPPRSFFQEVRTLIFQPGPSWGQERKRTPHFQLEGRQAWGWRVGDSKEVKKEPNCFPSSHLCAPPERGFRPRTPVAARKLCPFKGTVASRRGGGKEGRGLQTRRGRLGEVANAEKPPPLPAATATFPHPRVPNRRPSPKETF